MNRIFLAAMAASLVVLPVASLWAEPLSDLPLIYQDDFESGAAAWKPTDATAWKITKTDAGAVYSQFKKKSDYEPPHRSPYNVSLLKNIVVGDFDLVARVRSTHPDYGHRDVCLFFDYRDSAHFYYVHLGKKADDHANQIFIVNEAARKKISITSTDGTNWDDAWHTVKISRRIKDGSIKIYFDDMKIPVMTASDLHFTHGRVGLGSFDDTSDWDDIRLYGERVKKPKQPLLLKAK